MIGIMNPVSNLNYKLTTNVHDTYTVIDCM